MQVPAGPACCWLLGRQKLPGFWRRRVSSAASKYKPHVTACYCKDARLPNVNETFRIRQ